MALQDIINFVQLTPQFGTAGQPTAAQLQEIAEAGYDAVVNLALPSSDNALADEGSLVTASGMSYFHLPVDFAAPTASQARMFNELLNALGQRQVFVHCAMNLRVSAFMYHYLKIERGLDEQQARSPVIEKWQPRMDDVWTSFFALTPEQIQSSD